MMISMKNKIKMIVLALVAFPVFISCNNNTTNPDNNKQNTIVSSHGLLKVNVNQIVDKNNRPFAVRGMSLFWSQWAGQYFNYSTIKWLKDDWKVTVVRASMGVEYGGYLENRTVEYNKIKEVIESCIDLGIYVIVDWHDHHAESHEQDAVDFFDSISKEYGNYSNIIYEIYNEPLNISWTNTLKPYAEKVISSIRKNDADNLIIVGTPNWSQDVDQVIDNEILDPNLAYVLHFYAGSHQSWLRDKAKRAMDNGLPLFISEWGTSLADATGGVFRDEVNNWAGFMENYKLSWCNWSVNNKDETTSILLPTTNKLSEWTMDELSESGKLVRDYLIYLNTPYFEDLNN